MVAKSVHCAETCGTTIQIRRTHIGRVTAHDLQKRTFQLVHLGRDTSCIEAVEVRVCPGMGSNLVSSIVCTVDHRGVVAYRTPVLPTMNSNIVLANSRSTRVLHIRLQNTHLTKNVAFAPFAFRRFTSS